MHKFNYNFFHFVNNPDYFCGIKVFRLNGTQIWKAELFKSHSVSIQRDWKLYIVASEVEKEYFGISCEILQK